MKANYRHNLLHAWRFWDPFVEHPALQFAFEAGSSFPFIFTAALDVFCLTAVTCWNLGATIFSELTTATSYLTICTALKNKQFFLPLLNLPFSPPSLKKKNGFGK